MKPPSPARVEIVQETLHGVTISDPYRWMEDGHSQELADFVREQGAYARAYLDALPNREALYQRLQSLNVTPIRLVGRHLILVPDKLFALHLFAGNARPTLVLNDPDHLDVEPRILVDTNQLSGAAHTAIDWFIPSGDGAFVAYGLSEAGSENSTLHVLEVATAHALPVSFPRAEAVGWLPDHRALAFVQFNELSPGQPETERYNDAGVYFYRVTEPDTPAQLALRRDLNPTFSLVSTDIPMIWSVPDCPWAIGLAVHGVLNEVTIYVVPVTDLVADPTTCQWRRIVDVADGVTHYAASGDRLFLVTSHQAPRNQVVAMSLTDDADFASARVVVPPGESVITDIGIAGDRLLVQDFLVDTNSLRTVPLAGGEPEAVTLPVAGSVVEWAAAPGTNALFLTIQSPVVPPTTYRGEIGRAGSFVDTRWLPKLPIDTSDIEVHEVRIPSHDGVMVPLTIIHRRGLTRSGMNPTCLSGYGSYGLFDPAEAFLPLILTWVERGGVFAFGHIRGGGAFGKEWHEAGLKTKKENTIQDFIACGEYLVREHYASPAYLAGRGTSAGGIPAGGAMVRRPDLWAAVILDVADNNALRTEFSEGGPMNIPEFGSIADAEEFQGLLQMDALHRVQDGVAYPAVLLTTGLNDPRLPVWQATKMTARLQAATSSLRPILLRVEEQGGHGALSNTVDQTNAAWADELAFLLSVFGTAEPAC